MTLKIAVLGNAIVDGLARTTDQTLLNHKLQKGHYNKLRSSDFFSLCADVEIETYASGGSAANVAHTLGQLGNSVKFLGRFGNDAAGQVFSETMVNAGVSTNTPDTSAKTMEVFVLITPDGQRTLATLGTTARMGNSWIIEQDITNADWLFIEGYLMQDQEKAVLYALQLAQKHNVKVAMSLPSPTALKGAEEHFFTCLESFPPHLIIGDTTETAAFTETLMTHKFAQAVFKNTPRVTTHSGDGATYYDEQGNATFEKTNLIQTPIDVTGSGDAFAAGFLNAYATGKSPSEALQDGHHLAQKVIMKIGARLQNIA